MLAEITSEAAKVISEGVSDGLKATSTTRPTEWLMAVFCFAVVAAFLYFLKQQDIKSDEREGKRQAHLEAMAAKFAADGRESQRECHAHSKEMMSKRAEDSECLKEVSHDLKEAVGDLKDMTKDTKQFVQTALTKLESRGLGS
jgi:hypothetical protein